MTYREAVARITGLRGGEMTGMRRGLERIETLLEAVGSPERAMILVQVAGTNGKGSVAAMLAAILESAGRRVGLFTSPHLLDLRERIRVDGRPIEETVLADGVEALCTLVARLDAKADVAALDFHQFGRRPDPHAHRGRSDMTHIQMGAQALVTRRQPVFDRRQRRRLDQVDHHRRGEDMHAPAADARRGVLLADRELGLAGQAGRDVHRASYET